jgi:hypothetical protein
MSRFVLSHRSGSDCWLEVKWWLIRVGIFLSVPAAISLVVIGVLLLREPRHQGKPVSEWLADFNHPEASSRENAVHAVARIGEHALPYLTEYIKNADVTQRGYALGAVGLMIQSFNRGRCCSGCGGFARKKRNWREQVLGILRHAQETKTGAERYHAIFLALQIDGDWKPAWDESLEDEWVRILIEGLAGDDRKVVWQALLRDLSGVIQTPKPAAVLHIAAAREFAKNPLWHRRGSTIDWGYLALDGVHWIIKRDQGKSGGVAFYSPETPTRHGIWAVGSSVVLPLAEMLTDDSPEVRRSAATALAVFRPWRFDSTHHRAIQLLYAARETEDDVSIRDRLDAIVSMYLQDWRMEQAGAQP